MLFTLDWLSTIFSRNQIGNHSSLEIKQVSTDSREKMDQALFIPLVGDNFDGHNYIDQAIKNGAIAVVLEESAVLPRELDDVSVFFVEDTLLALQKLAASYRQMVNPIVVGITGSNGKTTTKDLVSSICKTTYRTHATIGNFNNHIGLPLTILGMNNDTEVLILEMGMSDFGEIRRLSEIAKPNYGIITNIGESHIEHLGSKEGIFTAKMELLAGMNSDAPLIIDGDQIFLNKSIESHNKIITCGYQNTNDIVIKEANLLTDETQFILNDGETYTIPLLGRHHALNATYAITLGQMLNISFKNIQKGLKSLELTSMRFEILGGINKASLINDAYNASPTSMKAAIEVVKQMKGFNGKVLVLGDILELGEFSTSYHQSIADVIKEPITAVLTYGQDSKLISDRVQKEQPLIRAEHFEQKGKLLEELKTYLSKDNLVLFKASRGMQLETIIKDIQT